MLRNLFPSILCLAACLPTPLSAASFQLLNLQPGSGAVEYTEVRGPHAYTSDGALEFSIDWAAVGSSPVRLDLEMSWQNHVGPNNDGYSSGDDLGFGGYFSHGFTGTPAGLSFPDYQQWADNSVAFGYANIQPGHNDFALVWDFFGWGDTVQWRLDYSLAPVPIPASGLLFVSALALAAVFRRRQRPH